MVNELLCAPITPARVLNPNSAVFGVEKPAFGSAASAAIDLNELPPNSAVFGVDSVPKSSFGEVLNSEPSAAQSATTEQHSENNGVDVPPTPVEKEQKLGKKRLQKVRTKKHRPKIFNENKPKRISKPTPKREGGKRKYARKNSPEKLSGFPIRLGTILEPSTLNPHTPKPSDENRKRKGGPKAPKRPKKSCKRGIDFKSENNVEEISAVVELINYSTEDLTNQSACQSNSLQVYQKLNVLLEELVNQNVCQSLQVYQEPVNTTAEEVMNQNRCQSLQVYQEPVNTTTEEVMNQNRCQSLQVYQEPVNTTAKELMNQNGCQSNSFQVYQRTFRANDLLKCSRRLGPTCPYISKRKRTKRQRSSKYKLKLVKQVSEQNVTVSGYALRSKTKQCSTFALSPYCKRKRSKRIPRSHYQRLSVSEFHSQSNLTSASEVVSIRSHETKTLELESHAEITRYPPQFDLHLFDVKIHPGGENNDLLNLVGVPVEEDDRLHDNNECHQNDALIPITESSYGKIEVMIHPRYFPNTHQPLLPIAPSTSGVQAMPIDIRSHPEESLIPTNKSSHAKTELMIHPPHFESVFQKNLFPTVQFIGSKSKFEVGRRSHLRREKIVPKTKSPRAECLKNLIKSITQQLKNMQINDEQWQLVVRNTNINGVIVPYKHKVHCSKRQKHPLPKVYLDPETIRRWNLLMEDEAIELPEDVNEENKPDWDEQRELFRKRVEVVINIMQVLQGDRRFLPWKGSVVDSVVGVFLTQNVSDYLSSNVYMYLAAKFPASSRCSDFQEDIASSQESTSNAMAPIRQQSNENFIKMPSSQEEDIASSQESTSNAMAPIRQQSNENFIKMPSLQEDVRVAESPLTSHGFSCSSPDKHPIITHGPPSYEESIPLKETLEFEQTVVVEETCPPRDAKVPCCESVVGTGLCSCESGNITSSTKRSDDLDEASILRGILEEAVKVSADSNTNKLLSKLEETVEGGGVALSSNHVEVNADIPPSSSKSKKKRGKVTKMPKPDVNWEEVRRTYYNPNRTPGKNLDSIDWDAVRRAPVEEIADIIKSRGMNNELAAKIKAFLDRLVKDHGSIDLEWLKDIPPDTAKEFLLSIRGVGLKSTECVRLLTLGHHAFPVDTNIARIVVRLGWVPLEPVPGYEIHELEQYPLMDAIQKYLWPRLCTLDKNTLYLLHYQLITFGKVICTKQNPNCNACPLRAECRHFASAVASSRLRLRGAPERSVVISREQVKDNNFSNPHMRQQKMSELERDIEDFPYQMERRDNKLYTHEPAIEMLASPKAETSGALETAMEEFYHGLDMDEKYCPQACEPIVEVPASPKYCRQACEPIIEVPASPEPESNMSPERVIDNIPHDLVDGDDDILQLGLDASEEVKRYVVDDDEIPHIRLDTEEFKRNLRNLDSEFREEEVSKALVGLNPNSTPHPMSKIRSVVRLRTKHRVFIIPDLHPLLNGFERRVPDDPCPYLLAIWPKESPNQSRKESSSQELVIYNGDMDSPGNTCQENQIFYGTILIPCRTANRGSFPLNGTYFQVNEVFADHESSESPIMVPRKWIWQLTSHKLVCNLYCGSSTFAIARGMDMDEIQKWFWNGFVCVRAFNRRTRSPEQLSKRFHELPSSVAGKKKSSEG